MKKSVESLVITRLLGNTRLTLPWRAYPIDLAFVNCPQDAVFKPSVSGTPPNIYMEFWIPEFAALDPEMQNSTKLYISTDDGLVRPKGLVEVRLSAPPSDEKLPTAVDLTLGEMSRRARAGLTSFGSIKDGLFDRYIHNDDRSVGVTSCRIEGVGPCRLHLYDLKCRIQIWSHYSNESPFDPFAMKDFILKYISQFIDKTELDPSLNKVAYHMRQKSCADP